MLLTPILDLQRNLMLDAYTFSNEEIDAIISVLTKAGIPVLQQNLPIDINGRIGVRFFISHSNVSRLEETLNLNFVGLDLNTDIQLGQPYLNFDGQGTASYRCMRVDTPPNQCETINAIDKKNAILICAMVARRNRWFGGVPMPGSC